MEDKNVVHWEKEKKESFVKAIKLGALRDLAIAYGGTGELRKPLSEKEKVKRKKRWKQAKESRRKNRK